MVDVLVKVEIYCVVVVVGEICMWFEMLVLIVSGMVKKGDVLGVVCIVVI